MPVDINVTDINVPVSGSVATNDVVPVGTTYGTPVAETTNPAGATITMNADGTYEFKSTEPGVYTYMVPVCAPGQTTDCPEVPLQITVLDPMANDNAPVVNPDIATTKEDSPVTIAILSNDKSGNIGTELDPTTLTITEQPENGTVAVNADGTVTFTPNAGFVGTDVFTYQVCDTSNPAICQTAEVRVTVIPADAKDVTTAPDDYAVLTADPNGNSSVSGNVLTNDASTDPDAILTASLVEGPTAAQGILVFNADGSYTFTPAPGFAGPVAVVYTVCDDATPANCATATLHILVEPAPIAPLRLIAVNDDFSNSKVNEITGGIAGNLFTNDTINGNTLIASDVTVSLTSDGGISGATIDANGNLVIPAGVTPGTYTLTYTICDKLNLTTCATATITIVVGNCLEFDSNDCDGDGVINSQEFIDGTDPNNACDSVPSSITVPLSQLFLDGDCDGDGLSNGEELGLNPMLPTDVDNNGTPDYLEFNNHSQSEDNLEIFNSMTTNGDGLNDVFVIRGIENYPDNNLYIYNRWGVEVYNVEGYGQDDKYFRGLSEGRNTISQSAELPKGTYYFILRYKNKQGVDKQRSGYLYITK